LTVSNLSETTPTGNSVGSASVVPAVATPPDPTSIPIQPPRGSPRPPVGQLMPDVAAAEDPSQLQSPMKVNTPPPSTPSPVPILAKEEPAESFTESDQHAPASAVDPGYGQDLIPPSGELEMGFGHQEDSMFGDDTFRTEADGDAIMHGDQLDTKHDEPEGDMDTNNMAGDPNHLLYQNSPPNDFGSSTFNEQDSLDGPPPAKRQKVDSVSSHVISLKSHAITYKHRFSSSLDSTAWRKIHPVQAWLSNRRWHQQLPGPARSPNHKANSH